MKNGATGRNKWMLGYSRLDPSSQVNRCLLGMTCISRLGFRFTDSDLLFRFLVAFHFSFGAIRRQIADCDIRQIFVGIKQIRQTDRRTAGRGRIQSIRSIQSNYLGQVGLFDWSVVNFGCRSWRGYLSRITKSVIKKSATVAVGTSDGLSEHPAI